MAASKKSFLNEIGEDFLSCSICLEFFKNPKVLPCLHTFCEQCLVTFKAKSEGVLKCATCRIQCDTPIQELKSNFFLTSLLDTFQRRRQLSTDHPPMCEICKEKTATHRCVDCPQFSCDVCVKMHEHIPPLQGHQVLNIDKYRRIESKGHLTLQSKVFCSDHEDSHLEFYCDTCQVPVCLKCTIVNHRGPDHVHRDLQGVAEEYKTQVREMLEKLKVKEKQVDEGKAAAESAREEIRNQCEAEKKKVRRRANELIERVKREEKMLIDALDERAKSGLKEAAINIDEMEFHHGNIVSTHHYLQTLVHHGNAVHLLSTRTETNKQIMQIVAMETKPPISHDMNEFQPRNDLGAESLLGVVKSDACPFKCTVENIPKQLQKGESVNLIITTRDSRGKQTIPCQDVQVKIRRPDASWENIDVKEDSNGTHHVMITGNMEGKQQVAMTIGNQQIPGSPYHIPVIKGLVQTVGKGQLKGPHGLAINKHGDFVTADRSNRRVVIHDRDGNFKQSFEFTDQFAKPFTPCDVAISDDNEYFITDDNKKQIVVSDENGRIITKFGSSEIDDPLGIAINPITNNVYVSEYSEGYIRKYTQGGRYINSLGIQGNKQGELNRPCILAINSKGMVYVADRNNQRIQVFNSDDQFMFEFSTTGDNDTMEYPVGVAIDKNNYVYVSSRHKVTKYDSYGQFICRIDCDNDGLSRPQGVAVCNDGKIAVVDFDNKCIKVFVE
uniref:Tripartite motif-containing protein 2-like n=1 Tax=Saccoglossus kowalevskii TaxID=10224 RepID=A0ABM0GIZ1_SACKO|nr:PREDICTED: tripartite motif-containing protein 2-like [Saccoglossus kowalevskii]